MKRVELEEDLQIDLTFLKELSGESNDLIVEIIELFKLTGPQSLAQIQLAIGTHDLDQLKKAAHKMKSSVQFFGNEKINTVLTQLEYINHGGNHFTHDHLEELASRLEQLVAKLLYLLDVELLLLNKVS
ncbi:MAG: Hpt domain-containing protein [Chitinophagales bacterium]|nr:Hpt domain-containing protein [Chitinophagales bacterium]